MTNHPQEIRLTKKSTVVEIDWDDGVTTSLTVATLRRHCRCAECVSEPGRGEQSAKETQGLSVTAVVPLGQNSVESAF